MAKLGGSVAEEVALREERIARPGPSNLVDDILRRRPRSTASASIDAARRRSATPSMRVSVWQRDGGQCSFIDDHGIRCRATAALEFHHEEPHARGGPNAIENVRLRCRAHNTLAAEQDFGRAFVERKKHGARHDRRSDARADA